MANNVGMEFAGITDPGLVRSQNEDTIFISASYGIAVLADGMGGYNAGEVASSIAAMVTKDALEQALVASADSGKGALSSGHQLHQTVVDAVQKANRAVLDAAAAEPQHHGMGTTIVTAVFHHDKVTIAHVGDSRAYRYRHGELSQLTRDHSLLQEQIDAGLIDAAMARFSKVKNLVTRAVGVGGDMEVEIHDHVLHAGDLYLLCSDGLSDMLSDDEISRILDKGQGGLQDVCRSLVKQANDNGGFDNISVILVKVLVPGAETTGLFGRILNWVS
jgi:PPM family protein phosphatase